MSSTLDSLHPRHANAPIVFTPRDQVLLIPSQPHAVLLATKAVQVDQKVAQHKEFVPNNMVLSSLLKSSTTAITPQAILTWYDPTHPARDDETNSLNTLTMMLREGRLILYRWPYPVPQKRSGRGAYKRPAGKYIAPSSPTLAELDDMMAKRAAQANAPKADAPKTEDLTHTVALDYTFPDGTGVNGKPYTVKVNGALVAQGTLGADGKASISGVPAGNAEVEYLDNVDDDITATRAALKSSLASIIAAVKAETAQEEAELAAMSESDRNQALAARAGEGALDAGVGLVETGFSAAEKVATFLKPELGLYLRQLRSSYQRVVAGEMTMVAFKADLKKNLAEQTAVRSDLNKAVEYVTGFDPSNPEHQQAAADAYEMATFIKGDAETQSLLTDFANDYISAQSSLDWAYLVGGGAFEVIVGILTGGAGLAAAAASKARYLSKATAPLKKLITLLRKKKTNVTNSGATNGTLTNNATLPDAPDITANTQPKPGDATTNKGGSTKSAHAAPNTNNTDTGGEPISLITGEELLTITDLTLDGPIPLNWTRTYRSSNPDDSGLGHGWTHSLSEWLSIDIDLQTLELNDAEGRVIPLPLPQSIGLRTHNTTEQLTAYCVAEGEYLLTPYGNPYGLQRRFKLIDPTVARCELVALQDIYLNGYDFVRDNQGKLIGINSNSGDRVQITLSNCGRITALQKSDNTGQVTTPITYSYNDAGDLVSATDAEGCAEHYQYAQHIITQRQLKSGYRFHFEWDRLTPEARCIHQWGDPINGHATYDYRFAWDTTKRQVVMTDTRGGEQTYRYNEQAKLIFHKDAEGNETHFSYNDQQKITLITRPDGSQERIDYNGKGQRSAITNALGHCTRFAYDEQGRLTTIIDPEGQRWQREYNAHNQLNAVTNPLGETTRYSYNGLGLVGSVTNPLGYTTRYLWNAQGQLSAVRDAMGRNQIYRRDERQRLQEIQHGPNQVTRYSYNARGQVSAVTTADKQTTYYTYTALGLLESITDSAGRATRYSYDGLSQVTQRTNPDGSSLRYEYDGERNLTALINEKGERYQLDYDRNERLTREIGFDGRATEYEYNPLGHLTQQIERRHESDPYPNFTDYQRDPLGQLRNLTNQDGTTHFTYSAKGQLTKAQNAHRHLQWHYDPAGRVVEDWQDNTCIKHAYDAAGNRIKTRLPNGDVLKLNYNRAHQFTAMRRFAAGSDNILGEKIVHLRHDQQGREQARDHGNWLTTLSEYDPQGRLQSQATSFNHATDAFSSKNSLSVNAESKTIRRKTYAYNNAGQLAQIVDSAKGITQYHYDPLDRLTQVEGPVPEHLVHDPAHNLLAIHADKAQADQQAKSAQVAHNRLLFQGDTHFEYDGFGNRISTKRGKGQRLETRYRYNTQHQLIKVVNSTGSTDFTYDPLGRRISKTYVNKAGEKTVTKFLWQGDVLLSETETKNNNPDLSDVKRKTNRGNESDTQWYLFEPGTFKPLALIKNERTYRYHLDHLGTPDALSDEQGKWVWAATYSSYGNLAIQHDTDTQPDFQQPLRFQGQYHDPETNLHYNRHRYYDPAAGSFITQDPIKLLGGVNNYQYVPNPVAWIDPLGLACKEGDRYQSTPLLPQYRGEDDLNDSERWNKMFGDDSVCDYLDECRRKPYEVTVTNGRLVYANGDVAGNVVDTSSMSSIHKPGKETGIFVMDPQGKLYIGSHGLPGEFHHSSFLAGKPVSSAGEMVVKEGKVIEISNDSGHYWPKQSLNDQVFDELEAKGMSSADLDDVLRTGQNDAGDFMSPKKQIRFREANNWDGDTEIPNDWIDF